MSQQSRFVPVLLVTLLGTGILNAQWIDFLDVSATNFVAPPALGAADQEEKDFTVADFDGDGDPDVVVVRKLPFTTDGPRENALFINVSGILTESTAAYAADLMIPDNSRDVVAADLDQDGFIDLVIAIDDQGGIGTQPRVLMNQGLDLLGNWLGLIEVAGVLPALLTLAGDGPRSNSISAGDLNGDGFPDLYLGDSLNNLEDKLLLNDGAGLFTDATATLPAGYSTSAYCTKVLIADVNGDSAPEILKNSTPSLTIAYNGGTGTFASTQSVPVSSAYHFQVGDLNQDGLNDIYVEQDGQDQFKLNGSATGAIPVNWTGVPLTVSPLTSGFGGNVQIVDVDSDGDNDVVVSAQDEDVPGCSRRLAFLRNNGAVPTPAISDPFVAPSYTPAHQFGTFDVASADFDADGFLDVLVGHCFGTNLYFQVGGAPPQYTRGDANNDGSFDIADAVYVLFGLFVSGSPMPSCADAADGNDDGAINVADAVYLLSSLFAGGIAPAAPFPGCGADPTADSLGCGGFPLCP